MKEPIIISLGGSLIVPDKIDIEFIREFKKIIVNYINSYKQFVLVTGGGMTAREYQNAAMRIGRIEKEDLDWLGIHSTRLNGHLLRTIFKKFADPEMINSPRRMTPRRSKVLIGAGYRPGNSTDYVATLFARAYKIKTVINLSNISYIYDSDPRKNKSAKPLKRLTWTQYRKLCGEKWVPGMNLPFDPVASKLAQKLKLRVVTMKGTDLKNFRGFLAGNEFNGSTIE